MRIIRFSDKISPLLNEPTFMKRPSEGNDKVNANWRAKALEIIEKGKNEQFEEGEFARLFTEFVAFSPSLQDEELLDLLVKGISEWEKTDRPAFLESMKFAIEFLEELLREVGQAEWPQWFHNLAEADENADSLSTNESNAILVARRMIKDFTFEPKIAKLMMERMTDGLEDPEQARARFIEKSREGTMRFLSVIKGGK